MTTEHKDIKLTKKITIDGVETDTLRMREPTVADQLAMTGGNAAEQELSLVANLCTVAPQDLHKLSLRDYKTVQNALQSFVD